ncbi:MAG: hypothetical protein ACOC83_06770, partial [Gemmatimonadota bacterium]
MLATGCGEPTEPADPSDPNGNGPSDPNVTVGWDTLAGGPVNPEGSRHDDIYFVGEERGWLASIDDGSTIHRTLDGGETWAMVEERSDVFFRAIGFASESKGWAGNLNSTGDPRPGVALWESTTGGLTWTNITDRVTGPEP